MRRLTVYALLSSLLLVSIAIAAPTSTEVDPQLKTLLKQAAEQVDSFQDRFDAWVWLADMSRRLEQKVPDATFRVELLQNVHREATRASLDPELVLAVIEVESDFDQFAISSAGARGLMQVMPFWLKEIGRPEDNLFHVRTNLRFGSTILRYYLDQESGNRARALARYNGSAGKNKYPARVFHLWNTRWFPQ
ncbi:MAG: hypothetical protein BMS9Abin10_0204 [Gammaproteobacteria bacterium]|nr:MAG: hypothetical protein BMS9Abin10_0204 [Gammaproteobacteria bacterium]